MAKICLNLQNLSPVLAKDLMPEITVTFAMSWSKDILPPPSWAPAESSFNFSASNNSRPLEALTEHLLLST